MYGKKITFFSTFFYSVSGACELNWHKTDKQEKKEYKFNWCFYIHRDYIEKK